MRYGCYVSPRSSPPTIPDLTPTTHTKMTEVKNILIDTPERTPPLMIIDDFDTRRVRFGPITAMKQGGGKTIEVYYLMKDKDQREVIVKPVITTTRLRIPFDTKPYQGSDSLNLVMSLPENTTLFHMLRRLDGLVLMVVHHLLGADKPIEAYEMLQNKMLTIKPDGKYDPTFKLKLSESTQIKNIEDSTTIKALNLLQGEGYAQFCLSQVWLMGTGVFGLQGRALRVKWLPFVNKIDALGEWHVPEEAAPSLTSQFSD